MAIIRIANTDSLTRLAEVIKSCEHGDTIVVTNTAQKELGERGAKRLGREDITFTIEADPSSHDSPAKSGSPSEDLGSAIPYINIRDLVFVDFTDSDHALPHHHIAFKDVAKWAAKQSDQI